jgi:transcriptional regulator with PAS, ATPase and Fis domain
VNRAEILHGLQQAPALRRLGRRALERLLEQAEVARFKTGDALIEEGDRGRDLFLLLEGRVRIAKRLGTTGRRELARRQPIAWLGESALLGESRSATVTATEETRALRIPCEVFLDEVCGEREAVIDLLRVIHERMRESDSQRIEALRERTRVLEAQNRRLSRENRRLHSVLDERHGFESFAGESAAACRVRAAARQAAETDLPVLICGETGTGKELVARAIHAGGDRRGAAFVPLNCALQTETLLESTLFGHARGAFTGASAAKPGLVEAADGGTLFLDEVADMPAALQASLLRFLELGEFRRIGETTLRHARVRVIAATHRDLEQQAESGSFRRDLLYRLDVMRIDIPPLRERRDDLPLLIARLITANGERLGLAPLELGDAALEALCRHSYPGNVRELENEIQRLYAVCRGSQVVGAEDLSPRIAVAGSGGQGGYSEALRAFKISLVTAALHDAGGNRSRAAQRLGVHRSNLVRMIRELGVDARG